MQLSAVISLHVFCGKIHEKLLVVGETEVENRSLESRDDDFLKSSCTPQTGKVSSTGRASYGEQRKSNARYPPEAWVYFD